ncbi:MAG TPA: DoxX family protein [Bacteroidales bacterium]
METSKPYSKKLLWTGRVISILCVLFLLLDAIMKVVKSAPSVQGSVQIGWPVDTIQGIGIVLLLCTALYIIPRTAILGAILLTGYLGGAVAVMLRAATPGHPYIFPVIFGILVWAGLFLRDHKLRDLIPIRKMDNF